MMASEGVSIYFAMTTPEDTASSERTTQPEVISDVEITDGDGRLVVEDVFIPEGTPLETVGRFRRLVRLMSDAEDGLPPGASTAPKQQNKTPREPSPPPAERLSTSRRVALGAIAAMGLIAAGVTVFACLSDARPRTEQSGYDNVIVAAVAAKGFEAEVTSHYFDNNFREMAGVELNLGPCVVRATASIVGDRQQGLAVERFQIPDPYYPAPESVLTITSFADLVKRYGEPCSVIVGRDQVSTNPYINLPRTSIQTPPLELM